MADIVLHRQELSELQVLAEVMRDSGAFKDVHAPAAAAVRILAGREIGLGPVESMRSFHLIGNAGEPTADLLARLIRRHPRYDFRLVESSADGCTLELIDHDYGEAARFSHTEADREREGLALTTSEGKPSSWARYPEQMHFARAITKAVTMFAPDVIDAIRSEAPPDVVLQTPSPGWSGEVEATAPDALPGTSGASTVGAVVEAGDGSDRSAAPGTEPDTDPESGTVAAGATSTEPAPAAAAASGGVENTGPIAYGEGAAAPQEGGSTSPEPPDPILVTKAVVDHIGSVAKVTRYVKQNHPEWDIRSSSDITDEQWSALLEELREGAPA